MRVHLKTDEFEEAFSPTSRVLTGWLHNVSHNNQIVRLWNELTQSTSFCRKTDFNLSLTDDFSMHDEFYLNNYAGFYTFSDFSVLIVHIIDLVLFVTISL